MLIRTRGEKQTFFIGISTAAHHIEGRNIHSDWWQYEKELTGGISSGRACDSYRQFRRDRKVLQHLGCNSYRFSIEWSRIEPREGVFVEKEIHHYCEVIDDLLVHGIEPIVTLHHFTNPLWFENSGGWERSDAPTLFVRFVSYILPFLNSRVRYYTPINEPNIFTGNKYLGGIWHPKKRSIRASWEVIRNLARVQRDVYTMIKQANRNARVGTCVQSLDLQGLHSIWWPVNIAAAGIATFFFNHFFYLLIGDAFDFVGINFYSTFHIGLRGILSGPAIIPYPITDGKLTMQSEPHRFLVALRAVSRYGKPIMVTENGKLAEDDEVRSQYVTAIFSVLRQAIREGIPLIGYQHFTHYDSFEWGFAFVPKFGFYKHNPRTQKIRAKPSATVYHNLIDSFQTWYKDSVHTSASL